MVSRFLWLNVIGKERDSVGSLVIEGNLWSPLNQISTLARTLTSVSSYLLISKVGVMVVSKAKSQNIMYI